MLCCAVLRSSVLWLFFSRIWLAVLRFSALYVAVLGSSRLWCAALLRTVLWFDSLICIVLRCPVPHYTVPIFFVFSCDDECCAQSIFSAHIFKITDRTGGRFLFHLMSKDPLMEFAARPLPPDELLLGASKQAM